MLLPKGFEVEMYTGTPDGIAVGFSDRIAAELPGFVREPDRRNVEYTTAPISAYDRLPCALLQPRVQLRHFLASLGNYTLLPGSTLAMGGSDRFQRSDPGNPYHTYIEHAYGTTVVTASIHINIGIDDPELLLQACRLMRMEAPLYLALSASSPFLDGSATGSHSRRWQVFPKTPARVPLFENHEHYIRWTHEQLAAGTMQNVRHLWSAVRPNGPNRPYSLNRVELRICDLVSNPFDLLAITALMEARLWQMLQHPHQFEPLRGALNPEESIEVSDRNEAAAARYSLDAKLIHWQTGEELRASEWIERQYPEAWLTARRRGFSCFLSPLQNILESGNTAQRWLNRVEAGETTSDVYRSSIAELETLERDLLATICPPVLA